MLLQYVFLCPCACNSTREVHKVAGTANPKVCLQSLIVVSDEEQLDHYMGY